MFSVRNVEHELLSSCLNPVTCCYLELVPKKCFESQYSSVGIVIKLRAGQSGFRFSAGARVFFFSKTSSLSIGPTQPPIHLVPEFPPRE
jgi:hypothetical protein